MKSSIHYIKVTIVINKDSYPFVVRYPFSKWGIDKDSIFDNTPRDPNQANLSISFLNITELALVTGKEYK